MPNGLCQAVSANDALPREYKLANRHPLRQVDVADFINNARLKHISPESDSC